MPQLTRKRLFELLYARWGVDNPHALATQVGWSHKKMDRAVKSPKGPYFDATVELLELAGLLRDETDADAAALARERAMEAAIQRFERLGREAEARGDSPEQSGRERRPG